MSSASDDTEPDGDAPEDSEGSVPAFQQTEEEQQEIEEERRRRLAPENRPENAAVDNSNREFDAETGQFTDHEPDPDLGPFDEDAD